LLSVENIFYELLMPDWDRREKVQQ